MSLTVIARDLVCAMAEPVSPTPALLVQMASHQQQHAKQVSASPLRSKDDKVVLTGSVALDAADATASANQPCVLTINGRVYDVTQWANSHPGGPIIHIYNGKDASEVFRAFHGDGAHETLSKMASTPASTAPGAASPTAAKAAASAASGKAKPVTALSRKAVAESEKKNEALVASLDSDAILRDFTRLRNELEKDGFFSLPAWWFPVKFLSTVAMIPLAFALNLLGWHVLSALVLGTMWQQMGWVSHEVLHHQIFKDRVLGTAVGWLGGPIFLGFSRIWWNDRHNAHHAATNIDGSDPDIDNLPLLAWSASDVARASPTERKMIRHQQYYFWFILPLLNIIWCLNSIFFVKDVLRTSKYKWYRAFFHTDGLGIMLHYVWLTAFMLYSGFSTLSGAIGYLVLAKFVAGAFLAFVVFFNHYSCPKLDFDSVAGDNFVVMQLVSTRNMTPGALTDWFCGGLNYQVEHHLFPTMPRYRLYECSLRVKAFCRKHKLPYLCSDFIEGLGQVRTFLTDISKLA